jgi:hypothetical protein
MKKAVKHQHHRDQVAAELGRMPANPTDLVELFAANRKLEVGADGMIRDGQADGPSKFIALDDVMRRIRITNANLGLKMLPAHRRTEA